MYIDTYINIHISLYLSLHGNARPPDGERNCSRKVVRADRVAFLSAYRRPYDPSVCARCSLSAVFHRPPKGIRKGGSGKNNYLSNDLKVT